MPKHTKHLRHVRSMILYILLGLVSSTLVSFALAIIANTDDERLVSVSDINSPDKLRLTYDVSTFGYWRHRIVDETFLPLGSIRPIPIDDEVVTVLCGWPFYSFTGGAQITTDSSRSNWAVPISQTPRHLLPLRPRPLALILNSIVFGLLLFALRLLSAWAIRLSRIHRRKCPQCGYLANLATGCPECGYRRRDGN